MTSPQRKGAEPLCYQELPNGRSSEVKVPWQGNRALVNVWQGPSLFWQLQGPGLNLNCTCSCVCARTHTPTQGPVNPPPELRLAEMKGQTGGILIYRGYDASKVFWGIAREFWGSKISTLPSSGSVPRMECTEERGQKKDPLLFQKQSSKVMLFREWPTNTITSSSQHEHRNQEEAFRN